MKILPKFSKPKIQETIWDYGTSKFNKYIFDSLNLTTLWKEEKITTYEYLYYLNIFGGFSLNSYSTPFCFPNLLSNYKNSIFDPTSLEQFRDLSIPRFPPHEKCDDYCVENLQCFCQGDCPHGQMTRDVVLLSLMRYEPYILGHLDLQRQFDVRQLFDLQTDFKNREYVPEFFTSPFVFENRNKYDFGTHYRRFDDIIFATWAQNSHHFSAVLRYLLESDMISNQINKWIDLVFGADIQNGEKGNLLSLFLKREFDFDKDILQSKEFNDNNERLKHLLEENQNDCKVLLNNQAIVLQSNFGKTAIQLFAWARHR